MASARARSQRSLNVWPGYVDALATLLLAVVFLLTVFVVGQFFLSQELTGRDAVLTRLNRQIADLLYLSPRTVGHHLRSAMRKLRVTTRTAVAVTATETGLLHPEPASPEPVPAEPRNG